MTDRYKVTVTYDWAPDEPNIFYFGPDALHDYLTNLHVEHDPEALADGGVKRMEPEPDGMVLRWELAPPEVNEGAQRGGPEAQDSWPDTEVPEGDRP